LGACSTVIDNFYTPGLVVNSLDEHNISWRGGVDWSPTSDTLLYANVSKGFKAGNFPIVSGLSYIQFEPVKQESLQAYEVGGKATLFNRTLQVTTAVFDYEYDNKQVAGYTVPIIPFGSLNGLANVPQSRIIGQELQATWLAWRGLTLDLGGTHLNSRIVGSFNNYNPFGIATNFGGEALPLTPSWQITTGAEYRWTLTDKLEAVTGATANYRSRTNSALGAEPLFDISPYTLLDLHGGVQTTDGKWRLDAWGHNVTNRYYWSSVFRGSDTVVRFAGKPATYGLTLNYRF
jgi:iron complex outermembrane receptor protein